MITAQDLNLNSEFDGIGMSCNNTSTQCGVVTSAPKIKRDSKGRIYAEVHVRFLSYEEGSLHSTLVDSGFELKPAEFFENYSLNATAKIKDDLSVKDQITKSQDSNALMLPSAESQKKACASNKAKQRSLDKSGDLELFDRAQKLTESYSKLMLSHGVLPHDLMDKLIEAAKLDEKSAAAYRRPRHNGKDSDVTNTTKSAANTKDLYANSNALASALASAYSASTFIPNNRYHALDSGDLKDEGKSSTLVEDLDELSSVAASKFSLGSNNLDKLSYLKFLRDTKDSIASVRSQKSKKASDLVQISSELNAIEKNLEDEITKCEYALEHARATDLLLDYAKSTTDAQRLKPNCDKNQVVTERYLRYYGSKDELERLRNVISSLLPCQIVALCKLNSVLPYGQDNRDNPYYDAVVNVIVKLYIKSASPCSLTSYVYDTSSMLSNTSTSTVLSSSLSSGNMLSSNNMLSSSLSSGNMLSSSNLFSSSVAATSSDSSTSNSVSTSSFVESKSSTASSTSQASSATYSLDEEEIVPAKLLGLNALVPMPCVAATNSDQSILDKDLTASKSANCEDNNQASLNLSCDLPSLVKEIDAKSGQTEDDTTLEQDINRNDDRKNDPLCVSLGEEKFRSCDRVGKNQESSKKVFSAPKDDKHQLLDTNERAENTSEHNAAIAGSDHKVFVDDSYNTSKNLSDQEKNNSSQTKPTSTDVAAATKASARELSSTQLATTSTAVDASACEVSSADGAMSSSSVEHVSVDACKEKVVAANTAIRLADQLILSADLKCALAELLAKELREPPVKPEVFKQSLDSIVDCEALYKSQHDSQFHHGCTVAASDDAISKRLQSIGLSPQPLKSVLISKIHEQIATQEQPPTQTARQISASQATP
ncbi:hypothetical protein [Anaerobiospirillum succiniciproducens]|uniref:hypothetical protein n=1 Tax=Anaerobiospirillum succiniciproducens TaxID=13335 RepID=UPI0023575BC5|nr:hypothetical protein [Anaerobiospirillum succiniciproducens]MCI6864487.1 hypothetical protein [Anaerobiospirillum succiniciproducens]